MSEQRQLQLRLLPPPEDPGLPAEVVEAVLERVAALLRQVERAERTGAAVTEQAREVDNESRG